MNTLINCYFSSKPRFFEIFLVIKVEIHIFSGVCILCNLDNVARRVENVRFAVDLEENVKNVAINKIFCVHLAWHLELKVDLKSNPVPSKARVSSLNIIIIDYDLGMARANYFDLSQIFFKKKNKMI